MRTTIDLPADLHDLARQLAHENNQSMSEVVVALARAGLHSRVPSSIATSTRGMPVVSVGRPITAEDVRSLDDE
jgi:phosphoribosylcarboxyaminoimidazole (NCAIR) mutase